MKKARYFILFGLALSFCITACSPDPNSPDYVVATVNKEKILKKELDSQVEQQIKKIGMSKDSLKAEQIQGIKWRSLNNLINEKLILNELESLDTTQLEKNIDQEIDKIKKSFESEEKFNTYLKEAHLTLDQIRQGIKKNIGIREIINNKYASEIAVSDQEVTDFYNNNPNYWLQPEMVSVRHILVRCLKDTPAEEEKMKKKKIENAKKRIDKGEAFQAVAIDASEDLRSRSKGGMLRPFSKGQMTPEFEKYAFSTPVGKISPIFKTQYGYHFLEVLDHKKEKTLPIDEVKEKIKQSLTLQKRVTVSKKALKELKENASIEIKIEKPQPATITPPPQPPQPPKTP